MAAGIIALALEANRNLTWRDVQHLIVETAKPKYLNALDWKTNGVGKRVSHAFGFGMMDAAQFVLRVKINLFFLFLKLKFFLLGATMENSAFPTNLSSK
jgi:hypothetical protein